MEIRNTVETYYVRNHSFLRQLHLNMVSCLVSTDRWTFQIRNGVPELLEDGYELHIELQEALIIRAYKNAWR